ncbi:MAG: response regulator [Bacteriovoracia bacterium]
MNTFYENSFIVIDDEEQIQNIVLAYASDKFQKCYKASSGEEALDIIKGNEIDIAFCDIMMPGINGLETIEKILKISPHTICIFATAYADKKNIHKALQLGAYDFLPKPFDPEYIQNCLSRCIELINSKKQQREILEILLTNYSDTDPSKFFALEQNEQNKILEGVLGVMRLKLLNYKIKKS